MCFIAATVCTWSGLANARPVKARPWSADGRGARTRSILSATGADAARLLSAQQPCEVVRVAYEPRAASLVDEAYSAGAVPRA